MILYRGVLCEDTELPRLRSQLKADCLEAVSGPPIKAETVIAACDALARRAASGEYDRILTPFLRAASIRPEFVRDALNLFRRESLEYKYSMELGPDPADVPLRHRGHPDIRRQRYPLGVLFHIAAGNVDALPAYSVVEGLLAGNVNILKLPSTDRGASIALLHELTRLEPQLKDFIYVFDTPSADRESLRTFADAADGIAVWGGDSAVQAARTLAAPNTKLICWGHKLSFAYASGELSVVDLRALARHICSTRQLLCSSCQGIFLDTADMEPVIALAERFFAILREENTGQPPAAPSLRAKATLELYTRELEAGPAEGRIFRGGGVSVSALPDGALTLSLLGGNCWVKPLPREDLIRRLRPERGRLQTAGLLCPPGEWEVLAALLARAGVVRITEPGEMSRTLPGEAHDGTYPLQEYSRIVEIPSKRLDIGDE